MSILGSYYQMEQPLLNEAGVVESIVLNVFAGCTSDDCDSLRSDDTDEYVTAVTAAGPISRRKRKMLQPRRAAMYGSEVEGCNGTADSWDHRPRPEQQQVVCYSHNTRANRPAASAPKPSAAAPKTHKCTGNKASKSSKKPGNPACGPCDNCGTTTSPQWRHGSGEKPTVCNACGIRYLRTGSFNKAPPAEKKRAAVGGSGAVSAGGGHRAKHMKTESQPASSVDTWSGNDGHMDLDQPASIATTESNRESQSPSSGDITRVQAVSPYDSPASTGTTLDAASTPPSPLRLDETATIVAGGSMQAPGASSSNLGYAAQHKHMPHKGRAMGQISSRLGPSPLGRVSSTGAPVAGAAALTNPRAVYTAPSVPAQYIQPNVALSPMAPPATAIGSAAVMTPGSMGPGNISAMTMPAAAVHPAATAAGIATPCVPAIQPELLQWVSILASHLGSVDAAIAFIMANRVKTPQPQSAACGQPTYSAASLLLSSIVAGSATDVLGFGGCLCLEPSAWMLWSAVHFWLLGSCLSCKTWGRIGSKGSAYHWW